MGSGEAAVTTAFRSGREGADFDLKVAIRGTRRGGPRLSRRSGRRPRLAIPTPHHPALPGADATPSRMGGRCRREHKSFPCRQL